MLAGKHFFSHRNSEHKQTSEKDLKPCAYRSSEIKIIFVQLKAHFPFCSCKQDKIQTLSLLRHYLLGFRGLVYCCDASFTDLHSMGI